MTPPRNLQLLRLFVAAYEGQSFTAAASRENSTQSGVSQHIRQLEDILGVRLFNRSPNRVEPTPAADRYYLRATQILRLHHLAAEEMQQFEGGLEGEVTVGLTPSITQGILASVLQRFTSAHPNVRIRIHEDYSRQLTDLLQTGELDFAVVISLAEKAGVLRHFFTQSDECLVSAGPTSQGRSLSIRACDVPPLKLITPGGLNTRRQIVENYCMENGIEIVQSMELDSLPATLAFVAQSDWVTILPAITFPPALRHRGITIARLDAPAFKSRFHSIETARKAPSPAAAAFREALREAAGQFDEPGTQLGGH
jgi:LysR family nitrogen assimilation transcriptional regulator